MSAFLRSCACASVHTRQPAEISASARNECVCTMGMAPASTPRMTYSRRLFSRMASTSRYSAGMTIVHPASSVRWGIIMSQMTFTQRMLCSTMFAGAA